MRRDVVMEPMVEGLPMVRRRIGELEGDVYGSHPPPPPSEFQHRRPLKRSIRCGIFDAGASSKDSCLNLIGNLENKRMLEPREPPMKKTRKFCSGTDITLSRSSSEVMDQNIWKEFPEDLFEAVIARLPVEAYFRFRLVCQKWNMLLTSQSFSHECAQKKQAQTWFYTISHANGNMGSMYDPSSKRWYHPNPLVLPKSLKFLPVASAGGLICFLDTRGRNFYVRNPLTRSCKKLSPISMGVISRVSVGMTLNGKSAQSGYKILLVGHGGEYGIYDSMKNCWSRFVSMPSTNLPLSLNRRSQAVCINKTLHFMRQTPDGILSYDMETRIWKQFSIPAPQHLVDQALAEWGGRIILVGLLKKKATNCVCIWELQRMTLLWKEVDRMPNIWCLEFYGRHVRMTCIGNKGMILLSLRSRQSNWLITYDAQSREWVKVPSCLRSWGKRRQLLLCATAFQPCVTAVP